MAIEDYDKKPTVIKFEGSKLKLARKLTDELADTVGKKDLIKWAHQDLSNYVSLTDVIDELAKNLTILEKHHQEVSNTGHNTGVKTGKTTVVSGGGGGSGGDSASRSSVKTGTHDFSCTACYGSPYI